MKQSSLALEFPGLGLTGLLLKITGDLLNIATINYMTGRDNVHNS